MTHHISAMLDAHPKGPAAAGKDKLAECIAACLECAQACTACADACLAEDVIAELTVCIRTDLDCSDVCAATGHILSRQTGTNAGITGPVLEACRAACAACAEECGRHAGMHEHCRICAEACRRCEAACAALLTASA
ncbi:four-helix bundle copper-binding protein [Arthrobacter sp. UYEF20]|uniref:four-helix bundle copper-binding protein n=1 Tax=Arthrobacter sp. UYEF20 TaxID=1756363 RepID=UPI0033940A19